MDRHTDKDRYPKQPLAPQPVDEVEELDDEDLDVENEEDLDDAEDEDEDPDVRR